MAGWVCVLGWIVLGPAAPSGRPNCGVEAVAAMSVALGHPLAEVEVHGLIDAWPAAEVSLLDVQQMAERVRLPLTGVRATLDELLDGHTPCIVHLEAPDHFAVLLDGHERTLRFLAGRGGGVSLFARTETEARYSGAALILPAPAAAPAPRIRFDTTWSEFGVTAAGSRERDLHLPQRGRPQPVRGSEGPQLQLHQRRRRRADDPTGRVGGDHGSPAGGQPRRGRRARGCRDQRPGSACGRPFAPRPNGAGLADHPRKADALDRARLPDTTFESSVPPLITRPFPTESASTVAASVSQLRPAYDRI